MSKSLGYYNYTGTQTVASGNVLPLTTTIRRWGSNTKLGTNSVIIDSTCCEKAAGYYTVSINTILTASAAGTITVSLYQDGALVPGALQTITAAEDDVVAFSFTAPIRVYCGQSSSTLTIYMNGQSVTTMSVSMTVVKE